MPQFLTERLMMAKRHFDSKKGSRTYSSMIQEDHSAPGLLPRHVIDEYWEQRPGEGTGHIKKDLFQGAQDQLNVDASDLARLKKAGKY
jgi:hypothetical protein